jgi:hypothetical protein
MKKLRIGLLAVAAIISVQTIKAQTVDEIVEKHLTALGGKEKLLSLKTVKMTGNLNTQGFDVGITVTVIQGIGSRNDISVPGMGEGFQVMNATKGWNFMPFMGQASPEEVSADQVKASQGMLDVQGSLVNYKDKGNKVELLGKEKVSDAECYKLKLTNAAGKESTLFIDATTFYRVKAIVKIGDQEVENSYSDFKKNEDGYVFPFSQTNERGTIVFSSIETNKPVDEKIFTIN